MNAEEFLEHAAGEHGILVVAAQDRLSWPEREFVQQLGEKLYGRRKEALNG